MRLWDSKDESFVRAYRRICIDHDRMLDKGVVVPWDNDHTDDIRSATVNKREAANKRKKKA